MEAFFSRITDFLSLVASMVSSFFGGMFNFFSRIPVWMAWLVDLTTQLPSVIVPFILFGAALTVVLLVLGRL